MTDDERSIIGLGHKLIGSLPGQFLALALLNLLFLGAFGWAVNRAAEHREALIKPIIDACVERVQR